MIAKWITFEKVNPLAGSPIPKTVKFRVQTKDVQPLVLGEIKWFTRWRKYCFFPVLETAYEQDCLRDIAQFCEQLTSGRRQNRGN